jgi:hypothetical protein
LSRRCPEAWQLKKRRIAVDCDPAHNFIQERIRLDIVLPPGDGDEAHRAQKARPQKRFGEGFFVFSPVSEERTESTQIN